MTIRLFVGVIADGRFLAFGRPFSRVLQTVALTMGFDDVAVMSEAIQGRGVGAGSECVGSPGTGVLATRR